MYLSYGCHCKIWYESVTEDIYRYSGRNLATRKAVGKKKC
jgi:hypothetical protein